MNRLSQDFNHPNYNMNFWQLLHDERFLNYCKDLHNMNRNTGVLVDRDNATFSWRALVRSLYPEFSHTARNSMTQARIEGFLNLALLTPKGYINRYGVNPVDEYWTEVAARAGDPEIGQLHGFEDLDAGLITAHDLDPDTNDREEDDEDEEMEDEDEAAAAAEQERIFEEARTRCYGP